MTKVGIRALKDQLSRYLKRVRQGERDRGHGSGQADRPPQFDQ